GARGATRLAGHELVVPVGVLTGVSGPLLVDRHPASGERLSLAPVSDALELHEHFVAVPVAALNGDRVGGALDVSTSDVELDAAGEPLLGHVGAYINHHLATNA